MKYIGNFISILAAIVLLSGCSFTKNEVVAAYEAEYYNKSIYQGSLFAEDLCVASGNIELEGAPDTSDLYAAALFDVEGKKVDFAYNIHERVYPASITKIMTALVAMNHADLSSEVTVLADADAGNFAADEQTCGIKAGDRLTLEDLLYGLLLYSGNDNAVAIADYVGGGVDGFAQMMNEEANRLRATNTHFTNPSGLFDENHYTTAYDLYLIFNACLAHEKFVEIIQSTSYTANITGADGTVRQIIWEPTNFYALGEAEPPQNVTIIGGKTGTLEIAGNCLILLEKDLKDRPYISVIMGADTKPLLYQYMTTLILAIPQSE